MAEHFVQPPHWEWYIVGYFFLAGLAGGSYALATMLRLWGSARDERTVRNGYILAFPLVVVGAIFLTIDLGQPLRFWHMLIDTTPGNGGLNFKYWSPISLGSWGLVVFSFFSFISFLEALHVMRWIGVWFEILGSVAALFLTSYTGVVLSVSNQPIWSDSYAIGGLFVASALSASAALLAWLSHYGPTERRLGRADAYFGVLELLMIAAFFMTLSMAGTIGKMLALPWIILWVLVLLSIVPALLTALTRRSQRSGAQNPGFAGGATGALIVIIGVFLLRCAVILGAQS